MPAKMGGFGGWLAGSRRWGRRVVRGRLNPSMLGVAMVAVWVECGWVCAKGFVCVCGWVLVWGFGVEGTS